MKKLCGILLLAGVAVAGCRDNTRDHWKGSANIVKMHQDAKSHGSGHGEAHGEGHAPAGDHAPADKH